MRKYRVRTERDRRPRSRFDRALALTLVAGLGLLLILGLVFSIAHGSQQITTRATDLHNADESLRAATVVRAQVGLAVHLTTIDDVLGTNSQEAIALSVSEARTALDDLEHGIDRLESDGSADAGGAVEAARDFAATTNEVFTAIDDREAPLAREISETHDSQFQLVLANLEGVRDGLADSVSASDAFLGRVGTLTRFLVAFLVPAAVIFIYRDLLMRQHRQTELEGRLESERRLSRAREEFIANASHELRTPLTGINGLAQILAEDPTISSSDNASELLNLIISESNDLSRMVEDLLTTARLDAGALHFDFDDIAIGEVVREVVEPLVRAGVAIDWDCEPAYIRADGLRTRQVLRNLLSNAQKYGGSNIEVTGHVDGRTYLCEVVDDGAGVPDALSERIFERFVHRGRSGVNDSVGLGLAIVHALTQGMGGSVKYARVDGKTVFTVRLPLAEDLDGLEGYDWTGSLSRLEPRIPLEKLTKVTANPVRRALSLLAALLLVLSQLMLLAPPTALGAPMVTVNSTGDGVDIAPGDQICSTGGTNSEGDIECTLRAAIQEANASGPVDEIAFSIPPSDPGHSGGDFSIRPATGLPYLSQRVLLDGTSQPGYSGWPVVIVDGSASASNSDGPDGLLIDGNQVTVRGLEVRNWRDDGIEIHGNRATIIGNYIHHNDDGVLVEQGSRNVIGGTSGGDRNVVSGNRKHGVAIDGGTANEVSGNYIGIAADGSSPMANSGNGVEVFNGAVRAAIGPDNVVSANNGVGINVTGTAGRTDIFGNLVGTNAAGTSALGNGGDGIRVADTLANTVVGPGNVVSGNGGNGVVVTNTGGANRIVANRIGTAAAGDTALGNGGNGIHIGTGTGATDVGGTDPSLANVIAFNGGDGVSVADDAATEAAIVGNSLFSNGGLGIDLPKVPGGADPNDPGDSDSGANQLLNHPVITVAEETAGDIYLDFWLDVPNGWYRVEFFVDDGATLVSSVMVRHTNAIDTFSHILPGSAGDTLTATATRCNNDSCGNARFTSEFSPSSLVAIGNHPPVVGPLAEQEVDEETTLTYTVPVSDLDGDIPTFSMSGPDVGASIDPVTGVFTWTPTEAHGPDTYTFDITVDDNGSPVALTETATLTVTVNEVNLPPFLNDPGDQTVAEGSALTFTVSATDFDLPANDLAYAVTGAPAGASIDPVTGVFTWTPTEDQGPDAYTFDITVDDNGSPNLTHTTTITVTVDEVNESPVVTNPGDQSHAEGDIVDLAIIATDPDLPANTLTYTATGLPPGLGIDPDTGQITGQIDYEAAASSPYTVTITVTDDGAPEASHSVTLTWDTANTNRPPQLDAVTNKTVNEQTGLTFPVTAGDPDTGTVLTYSLVGAPAGSSIDPSTGVFTWIPTEAQGPNTYTFDITVADDDPLLALTDTTTVTVSVNEVNRPPFLATPGNQTINEQTTLTFTVSATDLDLPANTLTYSLVGAPAGASINPVNGVFTWTPTETQGPKTYTFSITVNDHGSPNLTHTRTITVTVLEVNEAPTVTNPGDQAHAEGDIIDLAITATDPDRPANALTYTATGLPPGLSIHPNTGRITGQIQYHAAATSPYTPTITVTDNGSPNLAHTTTITWDTANTNRLPVLANPGTKTTVEEATLTFAVPAIDPDTGTTLTYGLIGAPTGASIDPATGVFTWTPTEAQGPGIYTFDVTVRDDDVNMLSHTRTVTIVVDEANNPPVLVDDLFVIDEDQTAMVDVLANDTDIDFPVNRLGVSVARRPLLGAAIVNRRGQVSYTPPANFHGTMEFSYSVFDGTDRATAAITVVVNPVNDTPVAGDDLFRLVEYLPTTLDVLHNDSDVDGDRLGITITAQPDTGTARVEGDHIVYEPLNGWTGAVQLEYVIRDQHGASDVADVEIIVGEEVLVGARELADDLGVDIVSFVPPTPSFDAATLSLIDIDGITLLADSFFQTVDALRIPLGFLGVTVVMVVGLGTTAKVPALVFGSRRRHWAVVRLGRQQRLPAYSEPGGRKVVYNYDPTAAGIVSTGRPVTVGNTQWLPVDTPNGKAWIYRKYLTEQLDLEAFLDDPRPARLVHDLAKSLRSGRRLGSSISVEGLVVALTGSPNQIAPEQVAALMGDRRLRHLQGTDGVVNTPEEFAVAVAKPFLEAYDATPEVSPEVPHSRSALIPTECWNFPYLAVGAVDGVQPWLVFFEYRDGRAYIAGLGIDE